MTTEPHVMDLPPDLPFSDDDRSALRGAYGLLNGRFCECPEREVLKKVVATLWIRHEEAKKHEAPPAPEAKAAHVEPSSLIERIDRTRLPPFQKAVLRRAVRQTSLGGDRAFESADWDELATAIDNVIRPWSFAVLPSDPSLDVVTRVIQRSIVNRAEGDKALPTLLSPHDMLAIGEALSVERKEIEPPSKDPRTWTVFPTLSDREREALSDAWRGSPRVESALDKMVNWAKATEDAPGLPVGPASTAVERICAFVQDNAGRETPMPVVVGPADGFAIASALLRLRTAETLAERATEAGPEPSRKRRQPRDVVAGFWSDESAALILKMRDHRDRVATCGAMTPISVGELDAFGDLVREAEIMVRESKMIEEQDRATVQQRIELDRTIGVLCEQVAKARRDKRRAEHARECADERTDAAERQLGLTEEAERPLRDPDEVF